MNKNFKDTNDIEDEKSLGRFSFYAVLYITFVVVFQIFDFTIDYGFASIWVNDELAAFKETRRNLIYTPAFFAGALYLLFIMSKIFDGEIRVFSQVFIVAIFIIGMLYLLVGIRLLSGSMPAHFILLKIIIFILFFGFLFIKSGIDEALGEE